jgi:2'-hydroxyisoflavone reductase
VVQLLVDDRPGAFNAVGPAEPTTMGGLIETCARAAGARVEVVPVPADAVPPFFPLVRAQALWPTQQRSAVRARAAGMPATPLAVTAADVLAWDLERGSPPLGHGLSPEEEERLLRAAAGSWTTRSWSSR